MIRGGEILSFRGGAKEGIGFEEGKIWSRLLNEGISIELGDGSVG